MSSPLDLNNVQGDILLDGLPKETETYFFFQINDVQGFRTQLAQLIPLITTTVQVTGDRENIMQLKKREAEKKRTHPKKSDAQKPLTRELIPMSGVNIAFSAQALQKMGITDDIGDSAFNNGMLADAKNLGDSGTSSSGTFDPDWFPEFKQKIDGLIIVSGDSHPTVDAKLGEIKNIFSVDGDNATIGEVTSIVGDVRPPPFRGHEHFGFLDGISEPAVKDVDTNPFPGQQTVRQGVILLGREGDSVTRPSWALDGSFLCFRFLHQLVPEFDFFLAQNALPIPDPSAPKDLGANLLGARLVGRWKSGAPIDLAPILDDPLLGKDPNRNNNFNYGPDLQTQERCPFAAHTRKTNPRADLDAFRGTEIRRIIRRGIQFGPEVSDAENNSHQTTQQRGLLFVCYQSNIGNGFEFIQESWANSTSFPPTKPTVPGFDPIIGQTSDLQVRTMSGTNPNDQGSNLSLTAEWVVAKGGEYFFTPSIPALQGTFALTG